MRLTSIKENEDLKEKYDEDNPCKVIDRLAGRWSLYLAVICFIPSLVKIPSATNALVSVFIMAKENYTCFACESQALQDNFGDGLIKIGIDECGRPRVDHCLVDSRLITFNKTITDCCWPDDNKIMPASDVCSSLLTPIPAGANADEKFTPCQKRRYQRTSTTARATFDMVCHDNWKADLATSLFYAGFGVGGVIGGVIADRYGRKYVTIVFAVLLAVGDVVTSYVRTAQQFNVMRFVLGFTLNGMMVPGFALCMELIPLRFRGYMANWFNAMFAVGCMILSYPFAYIWLDDWRALQSSLWLSCLPVVVFMFMVPESYKWLISREDLEGAYESALHCYANSYSKPDLEIAKSTFHEDSQECVFDEDCQDLKSALQTKVAEVRNSRPASAMKIFTSRTMFPVTLNCCYNWFVCSTVYYGLGLNTGSLPGSPVFNNFASALIELPGYLVFAFLVEFPTLGRTKSMALGHICGGICCILSSLLLHHDACRSLDASSSNSSELTSAFGRALAYVGKFFYAGCFGSIYAYTAEIYPAEVRSAGIGFGSMASRVGGIVTPFILSSSDVKYWLPGGIFALLGVTCGLFNLLLPETLGQPLLVTMEETDKIYFGKERAKPK